jgi:hypothetical protein
MNLQVQVYEEDSHLSIKAVSRFSFEDLYELFDRVQAEGENRSQQRVILDVTEVAGTIPLVDMYLLGKQCSRFWRQPFRIAIVSPREGLNQFFENVAWNRGVRLAVVSNQDAAMEWLK